MKDWIKYSAYGVPFALPAGDTDSDGDCDSTDDAQVTTWKNAPAYDVRGDLNLDGVIDAADETLVAGAHQSLGRGVLTSTAVGNRKGYAGYEGDAKLSAKWHVRHRVLDSVLGRWLRRDPLGYVDGLHMLLSVIGNPVKYIDPSGTLTVTPGGGGSGSSQSPVGAPGSGGATGPNAALCEQLFNLPEHKRRRAQAHAQGKVMAGITGCYNGQPLACAYRNEVLRKFPGASSAVIDAITACVQSHEHVHAGYIVCPQKPGVSSGTYQPPDSGRDVERHAQGTSISCANQWIQANGSNREMEAYRDSACQQYADLYRPGDIQGPKHGGCP